MDKLELFTEHPEIGEKTELLQTQEKIKNDYCSYIEKNIYNFFAIEGNYGVGKTHVATAIGTDLFNKDYNCIQFSIWNANPSSIRRQFLTQLINPKTKNKDNAFNKKRKELSIKIGEPLTNKKCRHYILIFIVLSIIIFSQVSTIVNIFFNVEIPILILTKKVYNWYFIGSLFFSSIISLLITSMFYWHTGGSIDAGSLSLLGVNIQGETKDIDEYNFSKLFNACIDKNTYIIFDDIDRLDKENIFSAIQFLELVKECVEKIKKENVSKKENSYIVTVCSTINTKQLAYLLDTNILIQSLELNNNHVPTAQTKYGKAEAEKKLEDYIHKIFEKKEEIGKDFNKDKTEILKKFNIDESRLKSSADNLRQLFRDIKEYIIKNK